MGTSTEGITPGVIILSHGSDLQSGREYFLWVCQKQTTTTTTTTTTTPGKSAAMTGS